MGILFSKLRIGEKIGLSTGLVGLLFLAVIWHYHLSLQAVLGDYRRLQDVFGARELYAFEIATELSAVRRAEANFLSARDEAFAAEVAMHIERIMGTTSRLAEVDEESRQAVEAIESLIDAYQQSFYAIAEAWRVKGLNHNSGLQGAFRASVHELEDLAGNFKVGRLYLQLLQIRRGEKDLALRRELQYQDKVQGLIQGFHGLVESSELATEVKEELLAEIGIYGKSFVSYADLVLADGDIGGGKGPFRQAAHRIEDILSAHYVPDLETNILQLRRREKDYLLRGNQEYVESVGRIARTIHDQIDSSAISDQDKGTLRGLLAAYERDFLALVGQNNRIDLLTAEMRESANRITPLVQQNVEQASSLMDEMERAIEASSVRKEQVNLLIVIAAGILGVFLAAIITLRIVRPVRQMAGLLDRLTHENPTERIPTTPGARDEINAMAESLNTMADHKATFVGWWRTSMNEAIALRELHEAETETDRYEAADELRTASLAKVQQLNSIRGQLQRHAERVLDAARRIRSGLHGAAVEREAEGLEHSAHCISTLLEVVAEDKAT